MRSIPHTPALLLAHGLGMLLLLFFSMLEYGCSVLSNRFCSKGFIYTIC